MKIAIIIGFLLIAMHSKKEDIKLCVQKKDCDLELIFTNLSNPPIKIPDITLRCDIKGTKRVLAAEYFKVRQDSLIVDIKSTKALLPDEVNPPDSTGRMIFTFNDINLVSVNTQFITLPLKNCETLNAIVIFYDGKLIAKAKM